MLYLEDCSHEKLVSHDSYKIAAVACINIFSCVGFLVFCFFSEGGVFLQLLLFLIALYLLTCAHP